MQLILPINCCHRVLYIFVDNIIMWHRRSSEIWSRFVTSGTSPCTISDILVRKLKKQLSPFPLRLVLKYSTDPVHFPPNCSSKTWSEKVLPILGSHRVWLFVTVWMWELKKSTPCICICYPFIRDIWATVQVTSDWFLVLNRIQEFKKDFLLFEHVVFFGTTVLNWMKTIWYKWSTNVYHHQYFDTDPNLDAD